MAFVSYGQVKPFQPGKVARMPDSSTITCPVCTTFQETTGQAVHPLPFRPKSYATYAAKAPAHHTRAASTSVAPAATHITTTTSPMQSKTVTPTPSPTPQSGAGVNVFPYGTCTWWADQRYFQMHGVFVPWHSQANAWQWTARAYQYGWHVSSTPVLGAIINLQPGVQGAYGLGHVAIVEKILSNGDVIASNMAWGANPSQVSYVEFAPGPGVTFIYQ